MKLKLKTLSGSCQCQKVRFSIRSDQYYPYQLCYCSICRKTQGGGGYAINLSAQAKSLKVRGQRYVKIYHARIKNPEDKRARTSHGERHFCGECGSALWVFDRDYPDLLHPFASAIDTPLPKPPERNHICLKFSADWARPTASPRDKIYERFSDESIADWHERIAD